MALQQVLARSQQNLLFQGLRDAELDPAEFEWSLSTQAYRGTVQTLTHTPTRSLIGVAVHQGMYWINWWPNHTDGVNTIHVETWNDVLFIFARWMREVKADHEAPDLWAEIRKVRLDNDTTSRPELLKPFSPAEQKLLEAGLDDVEQYVQSTQPLDPDARAAVRGRFTYLKDAARAGARKIDWRNIFVGEIVGMVRDGLLSPSFYQPLMAHATAVLQAVFQFGMRMLGP